MTSTQPMRKQTRCENSTNFAPTVWGMGVDFIAGRIALNI